MDSSCRYNYGMEDHGMNQQTAAFKCEGCGKHSDFTTMLTTRWGVAWVCSLACGAAAIIRKLESGR